MLDKEIVVKLHNQIAGLVKEYEKAKTVYDGAGLEADLKGSALQTMANALQLQSVAIQNYLYLKNSLKTNDCSTCDIKESKAN